MYPVMSVLSDPIKLFCSSPLPVEDQVFVQYQKTWAPLLVATPFTSSTRFGSKPVFRISLFQFPDGTTPVMSATGSNAQPAPFGSSRAKAMEMVSVPFV